MAEAFVVDGYTHHPGLHCESTAARNVFMHAGIDLSEEMLFGLGEGLGFIYWFMKGKKVAMPFPFVGYRGGKVVELISRASKRLGITCRAVETKSADKAYESVKRLLASGQPVCLYVDMVYLPYMRLPEEAHFGGHSIALYGLDEDADAAHVSDTLDEPQTISLEALRTARSSTHQPFPPKNRHLEFTFPKSPPAMKDVVLGAIEANATAMANPPISNLGLKGILRFAAEIKKWPRMLSPENLLSGLVNAFVYIEVGGTGGGAFRPMYARFLKEAHDLTGESRLLEAARMYQRSAEALSSLGVALLPDKFPAMARIRTLMLEKDRLLKHGKGPGKRARLTEIEGEMQGAVGQALAEEIPKYESNLDAVTDAIKAVHETEAEANAVLLAQAGHGVAST